MVVNLFLLCAITFCTAQGPPKIASITVEQPKQPAHVGDTVRLKVTVTNISKGEIRIEESLRGAWEAEVYDPLDPTGKDLALPFKQKNTYRGDPETMVVQSSIPVGSSATDYVLYHISPEVYSHTGTYKVILTKREWINNVIIRSNPVNIGITPK